MDLAELFLASAAATQVIEVYNALRRLKRVRSSRTLVQIVMKSYSWTMMKLRFQRLEPKSKAMIMEMWTHIIEPQNRYDTSDLHHVQTNTVPNCSDILHMELSKVQNSTSESWLASQRFDETEQSQTRY